MEKRSKTAGGCCRQSFKRIMREHLEVDKAEVEVQK